jgi:RPA family protein
MSADEQSGAGRREVAYRVFAAEYDDADYQYTENEADERAPNYVVTPTGARVNRLFFVGVLTEVERVNEEMLRGRIVDPTGAFVVYAGQYQPDALTALERLEPPAFVAVTGKARTFQPEDAETIYTSVRPESINEVDADTRDRWTVGAARHTVERITTFADALEREERGEELRAALETDGVDHGLAAGIPLAMEHYATTPAYLEAVRAMAIEAAEVVAGDREEVTPIDLAPGEGDPANVDLDAGSVSVRADLGESTDETGSPEGAGASPSTGAETGAVESTANSGEEASALDDSKATTAEPDGALDASGDSEAATDEMYEFDEGEREQIASEYGTDFSTGADIGDPEDAPDASDPDTKEPDEVAAHGDSTADSGGRDATGEDASETASEEPDVGASSGEETDVEASSGAESEAKASPEDSPDESATGDEPESPDEPGEDVDLEAAAVEVMRDLDSGDGADRSAVIDRVSEEFGASEDAVADAIQDALMSGKCYEPGDGLLKPI